MATTNRVELGPILTGVEKYSSRLAGWRMYLSPLAARTIADELKKSTAKNPLRVDGRGDVNGNTLHVKSVTLLQKCGQHAF